MVGGQPIKSKSRNNLRSTLKVYLYIFDKSVIFVWVVGDLGRFIVKVPL